MQKIIVTIFSCLFLVVPFVVKSADIFLIPQAFEYYKDNTFIKEVYLDTEDENINVVESKIVFNFDVLEAVDVMTGNSIIKLWVEEPRISNKEGKIKFSGGIPNGYKGNGLLFKILFKAKNSGDCGFNFISASIYLNDGKATKENVDIIEDNCNIVEKLENLIEVSSTSHPNENKWYGDSNLSLQWDLIENIDYSYLLSKDSLSIPDMIANRPEGDLIWMDSMSYKGLDDGIYYFHLRQKKIDKKWSEKTTYRAMIDARKPEKLFAQVEDIEGKKYLVFNAEDKTSGIEKYMILEKPTKKITDIFRKIDSKDLLIAVSPYLLEDQKLQSDIVIMAIDKAGNESRIEILATEADSSILQFSVLLLAIIILIIITLIAKRKKK